MGLQGDGLIGTSPRPNFLWQRGFKRAAPYVSFSLFALSGGLRCLPELSPAVLNG